MLRILWLLGLGSCILPTNGIFLPRDFSTVQRAHRSNYDFIVIGSGAAGSAIANRLSEVPEWNVLLLEVGKRATFFNEIPVFSSYLQFTQYNWAYFMEKTPGACLDFKDEKCVWPRGKGLGGSSLINYMIYTRGNKNDFERWAAAGNPGWSYGQVLPYYKKLENTHLQIKDEGYHGFAGPLNVEDVRYRTRASQAFIDAGKHLRYNYVDYNGKTQDGFSYIQATTKNGRRHSADKAYLYPIERRQNLDILTDSRATKILIDPITKQAYGIQFVKDKKYHYVNVTKEVIISAGALSSPQLLMLSGVGPKKHLKKLGIDVLQDLPVGRNLQDHISFLGLVFEMNSTAGLTDDEIADYKNFMQWMLHSDGPLTSLGGFEALGFIRTNITNTSYNAPDIEYIFSAGSFTAENGNIFKKMFQMKDEVYKKFFEPLVGRNLWSILPMLLHPKSVGHLELKSKNPYHWPRFYGKYLSDPDNIDVKTLIAAIREIQRLVVTPAFRKLGSKFLFIPLPSCDHWNFNSDEYWECVIRHLTITLHHQVGTCKMGPKGDKTAVVDNELRVHGIKSLRVADTSIIPFSMSAHTNAPAYMIGEKTADYIKQTWAKKY